MGFTGEITVAARIIDYLSSGLYPSPAACLKELINNSYDADARCVDVFVKPDADRIIIQDDGTGMNRKEFERHFKRIAESHKRDKNSRTSSGRPKIGKIGIGFIAANEVCENLELFSTKRGSKELLHVTIDFSEMRKPLEERRRGKSSIVKADYEGEILEAHGNEQYTKLFLKHVRGEAREILAGAKPQTESKSARSLYGLNSASIASELSRQGLETWKEFDSYSETLLQIGLNVPVAYMEGWMPKALENKVDDFVQETANLDFNVNYDGSDVKKPIFHSPKGRTLIERFDFTGKRVAATGYFYAQHGTIKPLELHGLLVRIRNAAVGDFDPSFWEFSPSEASLIQRWISVEIWADDRLEDAMNIDRRTLRVSHPAYVELRDALHRKLRQVLSLARKRIYESGSSERKRQRESNARDALKDLAEKKVAKISESAAKTLIRSWESKLEDPGSTARLLRKFTVVELYEAVVAVAEEEMTPTQFRRFLKSLTERLQR